MIAQIFRPTKGRLGVNKLFRNGKYTTNAKWLIRSYYEPKFIRELKERGFNNKPNLYKFVSDETAKKTVQLSIHQWVRIHNGQPLVELHPKDNSFSVFVNAYYFSLFDSLKIRGTTYWGNEDSLIQVKSGENILGILTTVSV